MFKDVCILDIHDDHQICTRCFKNYVMYATHGEYLIVDLSLHAQGNPSPFSPINCPGRNCFHEIQIELFQQAFSPEVLQKIIALAFNKKGILPKQAQRPSITRCISPQCCRCGMVTVDIAKKFPNCKSSCSFIICKNCIKDFVTELMKNPGESIITSFC